MITNKHGPLVLGPRGVLSNFPPDVVAVVNGHPITKGDILDGKRRRQARRLDMIRASYEPITKPAFVWVFHVDAFIYHGWHLYVHTLKKDWGISGDDQMVLKVMRLFPCGLEPDVNNLRAWKIAFAEAYHYPTQKRPENQGLALAKVVYEPGSYRLLDIFAE